MLPAKEGDCLLISYGDAVKKYILIDGGRAWTYKNALKAFLEEHSVKQLELLVVTHVDRDHIDGMLSLVDDDELDLKVEDVWFNTWDHLKGDAIEVLQDDDDIESFGAKMGEELGEGIINKGWSWNKSFQGRAVELDNIPNDKPIEIGDVKLTLLSPDREKLETLIPKWKKECEKAGIAPGSSIEDYIIEEDDLEGFGTINIDLLAEEEFKDDHSEANGSSIAFILEYKDKKVLLAGDAHADLLVKSLKSIGASNDHPIALDAFKVPHHGSKYNISRELLDLLKCDHYLISTNGNYFKHPEEVAMARLIKYGTPDSCLNFNYKTEFSKKWNKNDWMNKYKYQTQYPFGDEDGYLSLEFETS